MMSKRVNIADVAREANVSAQTVSRALNNKGEISAETRERVLETVERLGYRPNTLARGLVTQKTSTLGLIVPDIANPFFSEVARGAEDAAHGAGFSLLLCNTMEDPAREVEALRTLEAQRVDGIILCSSRLSEQEFGAMMARLPAVILVNREASGNDLRSVCIDDEAGAWCATQHLLHNGRRMIAFLAGPPASHSGRRRTQGYRHALADAGVPVDPALSVICTPHLEGGYSAAAATPLLQPGYRCLSVLQRLGGCGRATSVRSTRKARAGRYRGGRLRRHFACRARQAPSDHPAQRQARLGRRGGSPLAAEIGRLHRLLR